QVLDEVVDAGPVLAQRTWVMTASSTAWTLYLRSIREGEALLRESMAKILAGAIEPGPQDPTRVTYHPIGQFRFRDLEANWELPSLTLSAELRSRIFPP